MNNQIPISMLDFTYPNIFLLNNESFKKYFCEALGFVDWAKTKSLPSEEYLIRELWTHPECLDSVISRTVQKLCDGEYFEITDAYEIDGTNTKILATNGVIIGLTTRGGYMNTDVEEGMGEWVRKNVYFYTSLKVQLHKEYLPTLSKAIMDAFICYLRAEKWYIPALGPVQLV